MAKFGAAFAAARKAGKKTFDWNGKKYTTKTKDDSKAPSTSSRPAKRPAKPAAKTAAPKRSTTPRPKARPTRAVKPTRGSLGKPAAKRAQSRAKAGTTRRRTN